LKWKLQFESSPSYLNFKSNDPGAFNTGLVGFNLHRPTVSSACRRSSAAASACLVPRKLQRRKLELKAFM
jgi:hypothetical protein